MWLAGDSITKVGTAGQAGFGDYLQQFLDIRMMVDNRGNPGESATSYLELDLAGTDDWQAIKPGVGMGQGDYLFETFGHNKKPGTSGIDEDDTEFENSLRTMLIQARNAGVTVILVTPMARRIYSGDTSPTDFTGTAGNLKPEGNGDQHGNKPAIIRQLAADEGVEYIDLFAISWAAFNDLDADVADDVFGDGKRQDKTHLGPGGAQLMAQAMINYVKQFSADTIFKSYIP